jgi:hypothetical protein
MTHFRLRELLATLGFPGAAARRMRPTFSARAKTRDVIPAHSGSALTLVKPNPSEIFYIFVMVSIEAQLRCEWHIADLKLRIAQLKEGSGLGSATLSSAEFIDLLQQTLDSWEERKKTLAEYH